MRRFLPPTLGRRIAERNLGWARVLEARAASMTGSSTMHLAKWTYAFALSLLCPITSGQEIVPGVELGPYRLLFDEDGLSHPESRGVWEVPGYGYVFEITEDAARHFSITRAGCWSHDFEPSGILFARATKGERIAFTPHELAVPFLGERLAELPAGCGETIEWSPTRLFDVFAATMTEGYAFFEERGVDWPARVAAGRSRIRDDMDEESMFDAFSGMLADFGDGHLFLRARIQGSARTVSSAAHPAEQALQAAFPQLRQRRADDIFGLFGGGAASACNDNLTWGLIGADTGYLVIEGMQGYADGDLTDQLAALHSGMDRVLSDLAGSSRMIVDISLNGGGMDLISVELASRFADERRLAFTKGPTMQAGVVHEVYLRPHPGSTYTKPTYVVTSPFTASAAEIFTMCMRALPHVQSAGLPSAGALSDILDKTLPNGWGFGLSNETYRDHQGFCHEARGVPPDIELELFDAEAPGLGHADAILELMDRVSG